MNSLIQLKGTLNEKKSFGKPGPATIPKSSIVSFENIDSLISDLEQLYKEWEKDDILSGALVSVFYKRVVPKSKRIKTLLSKKREPSNDSIVGAKFSDDNKHIITHFVDLETININIKKLKKAKIIVNNVFNGKVDSNDLNNIKTYQKQIERYDLSKSLFGDIISDVDIINKFGTIDNSDLIDEDSIINYFDTKNSIKDIMNKLNIADEDYKIIDPKSSIQFINPKSFNIFKKRVPYLVAMATYDMANYSFENVFDAVENKLPMIPNPSNEPYIGVIDTLFDESVYFSKWVDYEDMIDANIPRSETDYEHGTSVTSIIVDGPSFNPKYDDGCGRFRVKHFGVATSGRNSSITIMHKIETIIKQNPTIHVWNLSLGSELEVNKNFISSEAALLDRLQYENNIVFVIAGTNKSCKESKKIGSPADSINSLVVNAIDFDGNIASYSREGRVLSFFNKPDICYFGGDKNDGFITCTKNGAKIGIGTSYAAPWISRKLAYLIDVIGLNREIAKALIIDSAIGWKEFDANRANYIGFGQVPVRIEDVINSEEDEIKFYITGESNLYDTYTHNIPVPLYQDKYPFIARATLCYFPECSRNQGVDYTNTELDFYFGRIDNNGSIKSINENRQSEGETSGINEEDARKWYRKWDNVKHISQMLKPNVKAKQKYDNIMWGLSIKSKERLFIREKGIKFGVIITMKEINGVNRIDEFINQCSLRGWLVNKIDIENRVDIYNIAQEEIKFE